MTILRFPFMIDSIMINGVELGYWMHFVFIIFFFYFLKQGFVRDLLQRARVSISQPYAGTSGTSSLTGADTSFSCTNTLRPHPPNETPRKARQPQGGATLAASLNHSSCLSCQGNELRMPQSSGA